MIPIEFKECNVVYAKNQEEYLPLHGFKFSDDELITCWKLSVWERIKMLFTGRLWFVVLTFNQPLQPLRLPVDRPGGLDAIQPNLGNGRAK